MSGVHVLSPALRQGLADDLDGLGVSRDLQTISLACVREMDTGSTSRAHAPFMGELLTAIDTGTGENSRFLFRKSNWLFFIPLCAYQDEM